MPAENRPPRSVHVDGIGHKAPIPLAARVGPLLCTSAIGGKVPDGSLPADAGVQVAQAFANLEAVLRAGGAGRDDLARLSVTLGDEALRDEVNRHWLAWFPDAADRPARHIGIQPLGHGMVIQLEGTAFVGTR